VCVIVSRDRDAMLVCRFRSVLSFVITVEGVEQMGCYSCGLHSMWTAGTKKGEGTGVGLSQ
jgi:hypothetical protein